MYLYVGHEEVSFLKNGAHEVIDLEHCSNMQTGSRAFPAPRLREFTPEWVWSVSSGPRMEISMVTRLLSAEAGDIVE